VSALPVGRALRELADRAPGRPAITHEGRTITRAELERRTNRLARAYAGRGVRPGDLVTIALPNGIEFYEACLAAWKLGATPQPVSARLPRREREALVGLARPALVVGAPEGEGGGRPAVGGGFVPDPALSDAPLPDRVAPSYSAIASGGSTGRPKLVLSGRAGEVDPAAPFRGIRPDGCQVVPGPLYHNGPFLYSTQALLRGVHLAVMSRFDAGATLALVERHRADWILLVPTMMLRIWRLPAGEREGRDLSSLRTLVHLGAPCPAWLKAAWIEWLGPDVVTEVYAGTEMLGATAITGREWLARRGSVGRPLYGEFRIVDAEGRELPPGEVGEIAMRRRPGDPPPYRYIGAEARTFGDGWESLGDLGWMDADGYLYLVDRRTDLILVGGANVYPAEVEAALEEHPRVRSSAVIGLPDEDLGQRVHAIVHVEGEVDDGELRAHLAERLVRYKIPRSFERSAVPLRDDAGKVRRAELARQRAAGEPAARRAD
jgi:bile acid-coenzyme A ligase